jgi:cell division protein FtsB
MNRTELRDAKASLGLTLKAMAILLGYTGEHGNMQIMQMLSGKRTIRDAQARLVRAYLEGYRPKDWPK